MYRKTFAAKRLKAEAFPSAGFVEMAVPAILAYQPVP
jgi:hypothetical protein